MAESRRPDRLRAYLTLAVFCIVIGGVVWWLFAPPQPGVVTNGSAAELTAPPRSQVVTLRLFAGDDPQRAAEIVSVSVRDDEAPRRRDWPLSADHLVIAVLDDDRAELWRVLALDPRVLRGEFFGPDGRIQSSGTLVRTAVTTVAYPYRETARQLVVHKPVWTGADFELRQFATVALPPPDRREPQ